MRLIVGFETPNSLAKCSSRKPCLNLHMTAKNSSTGFRLLCLPNLIMCSFHGVIVQACFTFIPIVSIPVIYVLSIKAGIHVVEYTYESSPIWQASIKSDRGIVVFKALRVENFWSKRQNF